MNNMSAKFFWAECVLTGLSFGTIAASFWNGSAPAFVGGVAALVCVALASESGPAQTGADLPGVPAALVLPYDSIQPGLMRDPSVADPTDHVDHRQETP